MLYMGRIHGLKTSKMENRKELIVGIDTGVNTGYAIYCQKNKKLIQCISIPIHKAFDDILLKSNLIKLVRVEDARLRKFITGGREKLQGAGSIKRDAKIWEDFLTDKNIPFEMVAPKNNRTKLSQETFKAITNWKHKTNEHSRDAGMLVFAYD